MKQQQRKLRLNRETLRNLTEQQARRVVGGDTEDGSVCGAGTCNSCPGMTCLQSDCVGCGSDPGGSFMSYCSYCSDFNC